MKTLYLTLAVVILFASLSLHAQSVGINTGSDLHDSAVLQIESTSKGVLIPRMTTAERLAISGPVVGLLVYDTTTLSFWSYDGDDWKQIAHDRAWYVEGTDEIPMDNTADIYHMGRIAIGKDTARYSLDIQSSDLRALNIKSASNSVSSETFYGSRIEMANDGLAMSFGSFIDIESNSSSAKIGNLTYVHGDGNGTKYGSRVVLGGNGNGQMYGTENSVSSNGTGDLIGTRNSLSGVGNSEKTGIYNSISGNGGLHYGVINVVVSDSCISQGGTYSSAYSLGGASNTYGARNYVFSLSTGTAYGTFNDLNTRGSGVHYGSFNRVDNHNISGTQIAGYFEASGVGTNYAAIFESGNVVANESGEDYDFRIESDDEENIFFVDGSADRIGIGTNAPSARVEARDSINEGPVLKIVNRNKGNFSDGIIVQTGPDSNPTPFNQYLQFRDGNGSVIGSISGNGSGGTQFNTTSDRRLKMHITDYTRGLDLAMRLRPRQYEMRTKPGEVQIGFIAQELYEIIPEIVSGTPDNAVETPMMVDYSKLTPVLVSAVQQQQLMIAQLEGRIAELESLVLRGTASRARK